MNKMLLTILFVGASGLNALATQETYSCNLTQKVNNPVIGGGGVFLEVTADSNADLQVREKSMGRFKAQIYTAKGEIKAVAVVDLKSGLRSSSNVSVLLEDKQAGESLSIYCGKKSIVSIPQLPSKM